MTRAATQTQTQTQSERLVRAYNASHKNEVKLTVICTDNHQARAAAAAGGKNLPDLFAADVIYAPNYVNQGLWRDITGKINALLRSTIALVQSLARGFVERLLRTADPVERRREVHPAGRHRRDARAGVRSANYGALEAGVVMMALPCVVLFLALQRHYVQGFTTGAIRG